MTTYAHELLNKPLALSPEWLLRSSERLLAMGKDEKLNKLLAASSFGAGFDWLDSSDWRSEYQPYDVSSEGILTIPVAGALLSGVPYSVPDCVTGYEYLQAALARGAADPAVRGIVLNVDSPGGEAGGMFDTASAVKAAASSKPVLGYANNAMSAAYGIVSAADSVVANAHGWTGSIGVISQRTDTSQALANAGIKVNLITAGAHKADGCSSQPMTDGERARLQAIVDDAYGEFTSLVAQNRDMDVQAIRDTEATTYGAKEAVALGLADSIATPSQALANFVSTIDTQEAELATENQAAIDAAVTAARAEERGLAMTAERTRISAILGSAEAKDRPALAQHMALSTAMSAEDAIGILAASAVETPAAAPAAAAPAQPATPAPAAAAPFAQAMLATGNPNVGAEIAAAQPQVPAKSRAEAALAVRFGTDK